MRPKRKHTSNGIITFHTSFAVNLLRSEFQDSSSHLKGPAESQKSPSQPRGPFAKIKAKTSDATSPSKQQSGSRQIRRSHISHRQLQAKMEAENQQAANIIQPLLEVRNDFVKGLERFFSQRDVTELRRRELLHKHWTEHVWFPLQKSVEGRVFQLVEAKRRQCLFSHCLHHCNNKGLVFLETYDLKEYNPFLLNIKQPHYFKPSSADLKDPFYLQLHERLKDQRTARCEAGCKHRLPQSDHPCASSGASQAVIPHQASLHFQSSKLRKVKAQSGTPGGESSKLETVPYHIRASSTLDGTCKRPDCWFSRCRQRQASFQQPMSTLK